MKRIASFSKATSIGSFFAIATIVIGSLIACSDDHDDDDHAASHSEAGPVCTTLGERCHEGTSALAVECHELGHDGDEAKCVAREAECLAECPEHHEQDGGEEEDGSWPHDEPDAAESDAGSDGG